MSASGSLVNAQAAVLRRAAQSGNYTLVEQLLTQGTPVDVAQEDGCTALWLACEKGFADIANVLCQYGAQVNSAKYSGNVTPLYISAQNGNTECVRTLLAHSADIDSPKSTGATPLFIAAQQNFVEIVTILLHSGANVMTRNNMGISPLMIAAYQGHEEVVRQLLRYGADPYSVGGGRNTLEWAVANNNYDKIKHVIEEFQRAASPRRQGHVPPSPAPLGPPQLMPSANALYSSPPRRPLLQETPTHAPPPGVGGNARSPLGGFASSPDRSGISLTPGKRSASLSFTRASNERGRSTSRAPIASPKFISEYTVTGTPQHVVKCEEQRQKTFNKLCRESYSKHQENQRAASPDYLRSPGLNTAKKTIETEWQAYRHRLLNQQQVLSDTRYDLDDSWMYSWGACQQYIDKTNKLRQEESDLKIKAQAAQTTTIADVPPGVIPPV
eukprot:PhF_6_TR13257/c0_g1_i2/m.21024